jgi:NADPH2:quinone reductase
LTILISLPFGVYGTKRSVEKNIACRAGSEEIDQGFHPMKAVVLRRFGAPDVLEVADVPQPSPKPGEVLVRVEAAGVNYFETLMREDRYGFSPTLPVVPGVEVAGVVEEVSGDASILVGSRVAVPLFAVGATGGYAQFVAVDSEAVHPISDDVSCEEAVALMVQGLTALHAVRRADPAGKTILVLAAAGGVGSLIIQLARRRGARKIIAAAGSERKLDVSRALGADAGAIYGDAGWGAAVEAAADGERVDIVYDFVGGFSGGYLPSLGPQGEVLFGALGRVDLDHAALNVMVAQNQSLRGIALIPLLTPENLKADLAELFALSAKDEIKAPVGGRYALDDVAAAHRAIETRATTGKVILLP